MKNNMREFCEICQKEVETYKTHTAYGHPDAPSFSYSLWCANCDELLDED